MTIDGAINACEANGEAGRGTGRMLADKFWSVQEESVEILELWLDVTSSASCSKR